MGHTPTRAPRTRVLATLLAFFLAFVGIGVSATSASAGNGCPTGQTMLYNFPQGTYGPLVRVFYKNTAGTTVTADVFGGYHHCVNTAGNSVMLLNPTSRGESGGSDSGVTCTQSGRQYRASDMLLLHTLSYNAIYTPGTTGVIYVYTYCSQ